MSTHHHSHPAVHLTVHEDDVYSNTSTGGATADFQQVEAAWRVPTDHHARR